MERSGHSTVGHLTVGQYALTRLGEQERGELGRLLMAASLVAEPLQ